MLRNNLISGGKNQKYSWQINERMIAHIDKNAYHN